MTNILKALNSNSARPIHWHRWLMVPNRAFGERKMRLGVVVGRHALEAASGAAIS
jgi:hypothetical protein